jgi:hypothetical protein
MRYSIDRLRLWPALGCAACLAAAMMAASCAPAHKAPPTTQNFVDSRMVATVVAAPDAVAKATTRAFSDLGMSSDSLRTSPTTATVTGHSASGEAVSVEVQALDQTICQLTIHVAPFGQKDFSEHILERIKSRLEHPSPTRN